MSLASQRSARISFVALGADDDTEARVTAGNYADADDPTDTDEETDDLEPVNASLNMSTKPKTQSRPDRILQCR